MRLNSNKMFDSIDTLFDSGKDLTVDTAKSHEDRIKALKESVEKKRAAKLLEQQKTSRREALRESYKTKIDSKLRDKSKLKDRSKLRDESKLKDRTKLADKDLKEEAVSENKFYIIGMNDFQKLLDSNGGAFEDGYLEITRDEANDLAQKQGFFASELGFGTEGEEQELNEIGPLAAGLLGAAGGAIVGNLATSAMTRDDDIEEAAEGKKSLKESDFDDIVSEVKDLCDYYESKGRIKCKIDYTNKNDIINKLEKLAPYFEDYSESDRDKALSLANQLKMLDKSGSLDDSAALADAINDYYVEYYGCDLYDVIDLDRGGITMRKLRSLVKKNYDKVSEIYNQEAKNWDDNFRICDELSDFLNSLVEAAEACPKCKKVPCVCKECDTKNIKFREADISHRRHK